MFEDDRIVEYDGDFFGSPQATGMTIESAAVTLLAPCVPSKMIALWNNKPGTSIIGPNELIERPAGYSGRIAYEGELGIVIGRRCKDVTVGEAAGYIFGYTCVNDVTAADVLNETPDFAQWCRSKGYDTFGCIGPVIATDLDFGSARVITRLGDVERQNYPLSDMIMSPAELVSHISYDMTLLPGDVIACGTSLGIGSIRDGGAVEVEINGIGSLRNVLAANAAPTSGAGVSPQ